MATFKELKFVPRVKSSAISSPDPSSKNIPKEYRYPKAGCSRAPCPSHHRIAASPGEPLCRRAPARSPSEAGGPRGPVPRRYRLGKRGSSTPGRGTSGDPSSAHGFRPLSGHLPRGSPRAALRGTAARAPAPASAPARCRRTRRGRSRWREAGRPAAPERRQRWKGVGRSLQRRRGGQVVRRRSRKPKITGSNPVRALTGPRRWQLPRSFLRAGGSGGSGPVRLQGRHCTAPSASNAPRSVAAAAPGLRKQPDKQPPSLARHLGQTTVLTAVLTPATFSFRASNPDLRESGPHLEEARGEDGSKRARKSCLPAPRKTPCHFGAGAERWGRFCWGVTGNAAPSPSMSHHPTLQTQLGQQRHEQPGHSLGTLRGPAAKPAHPVRG
ncbi:PREDICTED: uncharacterized protein C10orf95-like [Calidris pugnax]|uniref:uncharacterized protein C10orf95-like n=1 Tax=Calidris pugnax TaxID=198806 RepID=UPI00071C9B1F|nr:PREDICTED: uncharacterized protein C10orf95-like [Calidris pugnax]